MPVLRRSKVYTHEEAHQMGGPNEIQQKLLEDLFENEGKFLKDGRQYVISITNGTPEQLQNQNAARYRISIHWWIALYKQAKIGDFVHPDLLCGDYKGLDEIGEELPRFEATRDGMTFDPDPQGWRRRS